VRAGAHASFCTTQTRLGINQELPGGHDLLAFLKSGDDAGVIVVLFTDTDFNGLKSMVIAGHNHEIARAGVNDRF